MTPPLRALLADDHAIVTQGLRRILEPVCEIVAEVADGRALVTAAREYSLDLIIVDISMPLLNGIEATRQIRKFDQKVIIIFLTMHPDVTYAAEALRAGGSAYVLKSAAGTEILDAIQTTMSGRIYLSASLNAEVVLAQLGHTGQSGGMAPALTPRQREVLQLLAEGKSLKEVAAVLSISIKTAEFHKYRIMAQLGLRTNAEVTKYAIRFGITPP